MHNWTTWWTHAQRGMGLIQADCPKRMEIVINDIPNCSHIRFQFGTLYDSQTVIIKNAYCLIKDKHYPITFKGQIDYQLSPQVILTSDDIRIDEYSNQNIHLVYEIETCGDYQCVSGFKLPSYDAITTKNPNVYLLKSIEISGSNLKGCICAFGDSITEQGYWSNPLANTLKEKGYALLQLGISGNRLLRDLENVTIEQPLTSINQLKPQTYRNIPIGKQCFGKAGIKRFKDDVLSCQNIKGIIIALGVNDLYQPGTSCADSSEFPKVGEMMKGYLTLKESAHDIPIWILGITSFLGADEATLEKELIRCQINKLLSEHFQKVISFDNWLLNENGQIKDAYHNGDYLHPNQ